MSKANGFSGSSYLAHLEKKRSETDTEIVTVPSGYKWKLRQVDIKTFVQSDELPATLVAKSLANVQGKLSDKNMALTQKEMVGEIIFKREVVKQATVLPKMVTNASNKDEVSAKDVSNEDYEYIFMWAVGGGGEADLVENFRNGSTQTPLARATTKRNKPKRK